MQLTRQQDPHSKQLPHGAENQANQRIMGMQTTRQHGPHSKQQSHGTENYRTMGMQTTSQQGPHNKQPPQARRTRQIRGSWACKQPDSKVLTANNNQREPGKGMKTIQGYREGTTIIWSLWRCSLPLFGASGDAASHPTSPLHHCLRHPGLSRRL